MIIINEELLTILEFLAYHITDELIKKECTDVRIHTVKVQVSHPSGATQAQARLLAPHSCEEHPKGEVQAGNHSLEKATLPLLSPCQPLSSLQSVRNRTCL